MRKLHVATRIREEHRCTIWKTNSWGLERYSDMSWIGKPDEQHGYGQIWANRQECSRQFNLNLASLVTTARNEGIYGNQQGDQCGDRSKPNP